MRFSKAAAIATFALWLIQTAPAQEEATQQQKPNNKRPRNPAMRPIKDVEGLPRVLLIGDSISIGYTVPVREMLKGTANVHRPLTNCGPTTRGLKNIDQWLGDGQWDVIHFNWGLHDLKYMGPKGQNLADPAATDSAPQVPIDQYEQNLRKLVDRLKRTKAKLIWRSTTPIPAGAKGRVVGDSVKYNAVAKKIMQENAIAIDDQYTFAIYRLDKIQRPKDVHFTKDGSRELAKKAVLAINSALQK